MTQISNNSNELINKFLKDGDSLQYLNEMVGEVKEKPTPSLSLSSSSLATATSTNETDLLNRPEKIESYFVSIVDVLIDLKKYLNSTVDKELENSSRVDIITLQSKIVSLDEKKSESLSKVNTPVKGVVSKVDSIVKHNDQLRERLHSVDEVLEIVDYFEKYNKISKNYESSFQIKDYKEATRLLLEIDTCLNQLPEYLMSTHPFPRIIPSLKDQHKKRKNNLKTLLLELFTNSLFITSTELSLLDRSFPSIVNSLETLGLVNFIVSSISTQLLNTLLLPLLKSINVSLRPFTNLSFNLSDQADKINFTIKLSKDTISIESFYNTIQNLFEFIFKYIFGSEKRLMETLGREISTTLFSSMIKLNLKSIVPNDSSQLSLFTEIQSQTNNFESSLYIIGFFGSQTNYPKLISDYIGDIEIHFAEKKRDHILFTAREIIVNDKFESINSDESMFGESGPSEGNLQLFYFANRLIFKSVNELILLCKKSLIESLHSSNLCSKKIFQACRDIFDLFRFMYLKYHKTKIDTVPLLASLYYNSCLFFSHSFIVAFEFQQVLHQSPDDKFIYTFMDYSPLFTDHANQFFKKYIGNQLESILSYYDNCNGLDDTKNDMVMHEIESNFKRMINELNKLSTTWRTTFTTEDYFSLIAHFVDNILSRFIELVLSLDNISSLETSRLSQLCSHFLVFQQIFLYPGESEELVKGRMKLVKNWKKVWQLNRILDLTLSEIVGLYNKHSISRLSDEELRTLVLSIFAEFDLRTSFLETLNQKINNKKQQLHQSKDD